MSTLLAEHLEREYASVAGRLPAEIADAGRRRASLARLAAVGLPGLRDDRWRYSNLRPLEKARFSPARGTPQGASVLDPALPPSLPGVGRIVFVDGRRLDEPMAGPRGAAHVTRPRLADDGLSADERFGWLNDAFVEDGARIEVPPGGEGAVELLFLATGADPGAAAYPNVQLVLGADSRLTLIERHLGSAGDAALVNAAVRVDVGRGARLVHFRVQQLASDMLYLDSLLARVAAGGDYCLTSVALGARSARSSMRICLEGEAAGCRLRAMTVADGSRVVDASVSIEHAARGTRSDQVFRTVAGARARVGFDSRVLVGRSAAGSDSRQSLKGLISGDAEVNLRPQLEILTDDVRASHGATSGALDEQTLFYLLSRGIDPETARTLLQWAFLEDVLARIELPELRRQLEAATLALLGDAPALKELA